MTKESNVEDVLAIAAGVILLIGMVTSFHFGYIALGIILFIGFFLTWFFRNDVLAGMNLVLLLLFGIVEMIFFYSVLFGILLIGLGIFEFVGRTALRGW